jgi:hypothetical protein
MPVGATPAAGLAGTGKPMSLAPTRMASQMEGIARSGSAIP